MAAGNPSQESVARKLNISTRTYQAWEGGETKPSWPNLERLAEHFGVSAAWVLSGDAKPTAPDQRSQLDRIEEMLLNQQTVLDQLAAVLDLGGDALVDVARAAEEAAQLVEQPKPSRVGARVGANRGSRAS